MGMKKKQYLSKKIEELSVQVDVVTEYIFEHAEILENENRNMAGLKRSFRSQN